MNRIGRRSNWGDWDSLDGGDLRNGERLRLCWPDGVMELVTITVKDIGQKISDHGHEYTGADQRAYVEIRHHGIPAMVPIVGLGAERLDT